MGGGLGFREQAFLTRKHRLPDVNYCKDFKSNYIMLTQLDNYLSKESYFAIQDQISDHSHLSSAILYLRN